MKILGFIIGVIATLFVIAVLGDKFMQEFPQFQPVWEELKVWFITIYRSIQAEYGTELTIVFIVGVIAMIVTSKKSV